MTRRKNTASHGTAIPSVADGAENPRQSAQEDSQLTTVTNPIDQWNSIAEQTRNQISLEALLAARPRPAWSEPDEDISRDAPAACGYASAPIEIPLNMHLGRTHCDGSVTRAHAELQILQHLDAAEPFVVLRRWECSDGDFAEKGGSSYFLSIDEAVSLAHTFLLAADAVREDLQAATAPAHNVDRDPGVDAA